MNAENQKQQTGQETKYTGGIQLFVVLGIVVILLVLLKMLI